MESKVKLLLVIVSIPIVMYFWPSSIGGDTEFTIVYGESMLPTIQSGSLAIGKKAIDYNIGDIVIYKMHEHDRTVIHRIVDRVETGFIIKGDNNPANDPGIYRHDEIIGKVIFVTPYLGYGALLLKNPIFMTITVLALAALMPSKKEKKNNNQKLASLLPAVIISIITYVVIQISLSVGITPKADQYTTYLFRIFEPHFASTLSFATWLFVMLIVYLMARNYPAKARITHLRFTSHKGMVQIKQSDLTDSMIKMFSLLFITIQMIYLMSMIQELLTKFGIGLIGI